MERLRAATRILLAGYLSCGRLAETSQTISCPRPWGTFQGVTGALAMAEARAGHAVH